MKSHSTTILAVRRGNSVAIGGDGQVTFGSSIMKSDTRKIRRLLDGRVLTGFAGSTADAFALMERFEKVYGVHIILKASPSIEGLSGELRVSEGIEHALKVLQHVVDFQYEHYEGNILIKQSK